MSDDNDRLDNRPKLKVVKLLDPTLCVRCDHGFIAEVLFEGEERKKMLYCSRLDCDNWVSSPTPID